jgi:hypothetical protein
MKGGGREQAGQRAQAAGSGATGPAAAGDARRPAAPALHTPNSPLRQGPPRGPLPSLPAWGGCPGMPGHLSRRSYRCAYHSIHTAPLLRSSLRSAGGSAASSARLPRPRRRPRPDAGEGGTNRGRGRRPRPRRLGSVGDWALPTTTTSLWGSALGFGSRRGRSPRLLLGRLGAVRGSLRRVSPSADRALGNSEGESGWGPWPRRRKPARRGLRRVRRPVRRPGQPVTKSLPPCKGGLAGPRRHDSYLVDSASSHMLVSKIKPCMSKYKQLYSETANGSLNQLSFI